MSDSSDKNTFKGFSVEASFTRCNPKVDKSMSLGFVTKELNNDEKVEMMKFFPDHGWLLFSPNPIQDTDIPDHPAEIETKTPSQRLRATIYVLWEQRGSKDDFEVYYRETMEKFIDAVKSKLDQ